MWSLVDAPGGLKMKINANSEEGPVFPLSVRLLHPESRKPEQVKFVTSKAVFMPLTPKRKDKQLGILAAFLNQRQFGTTSRSGID